MNINILKQKQTIIIVAGTILLTILLFSLFIYLPKKREIIELKKKLTDIEREIQGIQGVGAEKEGLDEIIAKYNNKLKELEKRLPGKEEETLRDLSNLASKLGIEVLSINPQKAEICDLPINVKGYICKEMKISMELKTSFKVFGEYLRLLQYGFPTVFRINSYDIKKEGEKYGTSVISVTLKLTMYMLCPAL